MKTILAFLILFSFALSANGVKNNVISPTQAPTLLWEVSTGSKKIYILGSIHAGDASLYPLDPRITSAYNESDHLAVEVDISGNKVRKIQEETQRLGYYPPGVSIKDALSSEMNSLIQTKLQSVNLDISYFERLKPWLLALTLSGLLEKEKRFSPAYGIDNYFLKEVGTRQIHEIETSLYQLEIFNSAPIDLQMGFLWESLQEDSFIKVNLGEVIEAWKEGNTEKMETTFLQPYHRHPELDPILKILFFERNIGMVEKIEHFLTRDGTFFVVVGVGHLIGKNGVIDILEKKNLYRIKRI
jgi:uncharacterized protein